MQTYSGILEVKSSWCAVIDLLQAHHEKVLDCVVEEATGGSLLHTVAPSG
jgi:hypothetical protein